MESHDLRKKLAAWIRRLQPVHLAAVRMGLWVLAGCGAATQQGSPAKPPKRPELVSVTLGEPLDSLAFAPVIIAQQRGYFQRAGVRARIIQFSGATPG